MAPTELIPSFDARLSMHRIDDETRKILADTWPMLEPHLEQAIDDVLVALQDLPRIGRIVADNKETLKTLEVTHFRALLGGELDDRYAESCRRTVEKEAEMGLDARVRSTSGSIVVQMSLDVLARKHWLSSLKLAQRAKTISKIISFDVSNAMTLHRRAADEAARVRRGAIDAAIADFDGAISEVISAIKETSASLSETGSTMSQAADDTLNRMTSASSASAGTTQRMEATVTATEELSGSIQEIGQQATNGLDIAQSAVADAERTQKVISSLNEGAERIGSVVGTISAIAAQTNLLALNATIEAARAGEAGKGFAVVANEVKELAKQTAKATEDISRRINAIQTDTKGAVDAIASISGVINQINGISGTIATAVEEQSATTNEMTRNVTDAAKGSGEITLNIAGVAEAGRGTSNSAHESQKAANELAEMAVQLRSLVDQFKIDGTSGSGSAKVAAKSRAAHAGL